MALMRREHDSPVLLEGDGGFTLVDHLQLRSNRVKHNLQASNFIMHLQIYTCGRTNSRMETNEEGVGSLTAHSFLVDLMASLRFSSVSWW